MKGIGLSSVPMFIDHFFFGVGIGNWRVQYPSYQEWFWPDWELHRNLYQANAHNDYVEIVSELGLLGSIFFFWLIVAFFRTWLYVIRRLTADNFIILGPVIATLGISVSAVFSFPFKQPVPILFVMTYLALISCCYSFLQPSGVKAYFKIPYRSNFVRPVAAALLFIATITLFVYHYNLYISELNYRTSVSSLKAGQYRNAYNAAKKAYEHNPIRSDLLWLEGTSQLRLGDIDAAIANYKKVLQDYPDSPNTLNNLATAYRAQGNIMAALETYQHLVRIQPSNMQLKINYGITLARLGYNLQAEPYLDAALIHNQSLLAGSQDWWAEKKKKLVAAGKNIRKPLVLIALEKKIEKIQKWKKKIESDRIKQEQGLKQETKTTKETSPGKEKETKKQ